MIPVSRISWVGVRSSTSGAGRWIGQRSSPSTGSPSSIGSPSRLKIRPSVSSPTGTVIGPPVSIDLVAALQAVGGVHRDRAHAVVAEVLLDLADELDGLAAVAAPASRSSAPSRSRAARRGRRASTTTPVDLLDAPDVPAVSVAQPFRLLSVPAQPSASAPATTSKISCVISACRTRFISSVRSLDHRPPRSRPRCASRSSARRARTRPTRAAPGRPRCSRTPGTAAASSSSGSGS